MVNQWGQVDDKKWSSVVRIMERISNDLQNFQYRDVILDQFSFEHDNFRLDVMGLAAIVSFFYVAGFLALFIRIRLTR